MSLLAVFICVLNETVNSTLKTNLIHKHHNAKIMTVRWPIFTNGFYVHNSCCT